MPYWPPPGYVPVVVEGAPEGAKYTLRLDKRSDVIVTCPGDCLVLLQPREYWLTVHETATTLTGKRNVMVDGPTRLSVQPRTKADRNTGLAMGLGGIGLIVVGAFAMLAGVAQSIDRDDDQGDTLVALGLAGFVGGAVLTPIGWVQFGRSAPQVSSQPLAPPR